MTVSDLIGEANGVLALVLSVVAVSGLVTAAFRRMLTRQLEPLHDKIERIHHEVTLNHGSSVKDGVKAIAEHLGLEFVAQRLTLEPSDDKDDG